MNRDRRLANILLAVFSGVSLTFLSLSLTGKIKALKAYLLYLLDPVPFYASGGVARIADMPSDVLGIINVDLQNRQLRQQVKETAFLRSELEALRKENERLTASLGIKSAAPHSLRWARVMEREPLNWHRSVMVDAGSEDGVQINCPVLGLQESKLGIVGRIIEVSPRTSKVLLLTDELSAVAAHLPSNPWEGLLQGQGSFKMRMNYLPLGAQFSVGDAVYTSPTSAIFPPDLLIGTISRVFEQDPFLAFQSVEVAPAIEAAKLKEVLILSRRKTDSS